MMDEQLCKVPPSAKIKCISKLCHQRTFCWCCKTKSAYFFIWHPFCAPKPLSSLFTYSKAWSTPMAVTLSSVLSHVKFAFKKSQVSPSESSVHTNESGEQASSEHNSEGPNRWSTLRSYLLKQDVSSITSVGLLWCIVTNYQSWKPHSTSILLASSNWRGNCWTFQKISLRAIDQEELYEPQEVNCLHLSGVS